MSMHILPNLLSMLRMPLALAYLQENVTVRCIALFLAIATDYLDGYLARRYKCTNHLGSFLDPLADKCFFICVVTILFAEHRLAGWEVFAMLSREIAVLVFGLYLLLKGVLWEWHSRSIWSGKLATSLQLGVIFFLTINVPISAYIYLLFIPLGIGAFVELCLDRHRIKIEQ